MTPSESPTQSRPESPRKSPPKTPKRSPGTSSTSNSTAPEGGGGDADADDAKENEVAGTPPKKGKKKKKKKKKATLANEGNPHHIDKCEFPRCAVFVCLFSKLTPDRPSRLPSYAWHASVLFPPSLRFLAARNRFPVRENEYICFPCEVALYYASEGARRRAVSARYRALARFDPRLRRRRRKGRCTARRDGVDGEDEYDDDDDEYDDDDGEYDDGDGGEHAGADGDAGAHWTQGGGRCTCCLEPP